MLAAFLVAVIAGLSNHVLYASVDGQIPYNQDWFIRAGTALATICRISLAVSVGIALNQWIWKVVRDDFIRVKNLDTLFGITSSPWAFLNLELLGKAKLALLLALLIWLSTLIPVFVPGSLSVQLKSTATQVPKQISTLNFSKADSGLGLVSTETQSGKMVWNTYVGPSKAGKSLVYQTIYGGAVVPMASPCGPNCTFTQSFSGPSYSCVDVDPEDPNAPWCYEEGASPNGSCSANKPALKELYFAANSSVPLPGGNSRRTSDFQLWVRHRYFAPENRGKTDSGLANLTVPYENITFRCQMMRTDFKIRRTYINSVQEVTGTWTPTTPYDFSTENDPGTLSGGGIPESAHVDTWAAHALHDAISSVFAVRMYDRRKQSSEDWVPHEGFELQGTPFVEPYPWPAPMSHMPVRNFKEKIQQASVNATLSLFAVPALTHLQAQENEVTISVTGPVWVYDRRALLIAYGLAFLLGLVGVGVGFIAMIQSGVSMDVGFMSVLATTRNETLDQLAKGSCLGAKGQSRDALGEASVRFGELVDPTNGMRRRHAAFGLQGEVGSLEKGAMYE